MASDNEFWHDLADLFAHEMDSPLFSCLLLLYILMFVDVLTTVIILLQGGVEYNPLMERFAASPLMHLLLKWLAVFVIFLLAAGAEKMVRRSGILILGVACAYYLVVVGHNLAELLAFMST
jgi:hypothetical protein